MTGKKLQLFFTAIKIPIDAIFIFASFLIAYKVRILGSGSLKIINSMPFNRFVIWVLGIVFVWLIIFILNKAYKIQKESFVEETGKIIISISAGMMVVFSVLFFAQLLIFSRLIILYAWLFSIILVILERTILRFVQKKMIASGKGATRVLIIGASKKAEELISLLSYKNSEYKIIGVVNAKKRIKGAKKLGNLSDLGKIISKYKIEEIILADCNLSDLKQMDIINLCQLKDIKFKFIPNTIEIARGNIEMHTIGAVPLIEIKRSPLDGWGRIVKRIIDIIGSSFALIIFSPLFLIIAIAIKINSRGPVFFRQKRIGKGSKEFIFLKFRSMYEGAHKKHKAMMKKHGVMFKLKDDPRVTKVGKILRKTSLDEIPQFINVWLGQMSLVGPRPPMPQEVAEYNSWQKKRLGFKPGITGLWQVSGRSDISFDEWVKLDVYYIENWSLKMDFQILLKTIWRVIARKGAY